jgi:hypothetical protein
VNSAHGPSLNSWGLAAFSGGLRFGVAPGRVPEARVYVRCAQI